MNTKAYSISTAMLEHFLQNGKIACISAYLEIVHSYSGKLHKKDIRELSVKVNKTTHSLRQQLKNLEELGLLTDHKNGYFFATGKKQFNIRKGICHSKMVQIPDGFLQSNKKLRTFAYAVLFEQAARHIDSKNYKSKKHQNHSKRDSVPIAGAFMEKFKKNHVDKKIVTWNTQRAKAAKLNLLNVERNFEVVVKGNEDIKWACIKTRPYLSNRNKHLWKRCVDGQYVWLMELPAMVTVNIEFKKQQHNYSVQEKSSIKSNFQFRYGQD